MPTTSSRTARWRVSRAPNLFFYPCAEQSQYSRHQTGLQHLAFVVRTRSAVNAVHSVVAELAAQFGGLVLHERGPYGARERACRTESNDPFPDARPVTTPLLVLGATDDGSRADGEVSAAARTYQTDAEFFPSMGHMMMLVPGWQAVAERMEGWLGGQGL